MMSVLTIIEPKTMKLEQLLDIIQSALEDIKAQTILTLDVEALTTITDRMIICQGTSKRHVKSIADNVIKATKEKGVRPLGIEGQDVGEWVLVDLGSVVIHIMLPEVREFYDIEALWQTPESAE